MREAFTAHKFNAESLSLIYLCSEILTEYANEGYDLSLRQLYYQLVTKNAIPNTERSYKRIINLMTNARLSGHIDWSHLVDRTRSLKGRVNYRSPQELLREAAGMYAHSYWDDQDTHLEVWVEKDALIDIVQVSCVPYDVDFFSCRGFVSLTEVYAAAKRFELAQENGKEFCTILHLSDHDPSGLSMTDALRSRFSDFCSDVEVQRIALTQAQIRQFNIPPNPLKTSDSRASSYADEFGGSSWELDALKPEVLTNIIQTEIEAWISDEDAFDQAKDDEYSDRAKIIELTEDF